MPTMKKKTSKIIRKSSRLRSRSSDEWARYFTRQILFTIDLDSFSNHNKNITKLTIKLKQIKKQIDIIYFKDNKHISLNKFRLKFSENIKKELMQSNRKIFDSASNDYLTYIIDEIDKIFKGK